MAYGFENNKTKANIENIIDETGETKVDKIEGKGLTTNNYTDEDKDIVDGATAELSEKVDKETGKGLSTLDFTNVTKTKVEENSYNTFGEGTDLSRNGNNYYSLSSPFTCPHDGYVHLYAPDRPSTGYSQLYIKRSSSSTNTINHKLVNQSDYSDSLVFVKKGMRIYAVTSGSDGNYVTYYPQTSYT